MELINFKISTDHSLLDKQNHITPYVASLLSEIYSELPKAKTNTLKKLLKYTAQFPKVPIFKNYLTTYYIFKNDYKKAKECNLWLIKEHPDYLFGLLNYANTLIDDGNFEDVQKLLGANLLLNELYPERTEFHLDEVMSYFAVTIEYLFAINKFEEAELRLQILGEIDDEHPKYLLAEEFRSKYFYESAMHRLIEQKDLMKEVPEIDRRSSIQTTEPPVFNYPKEMGILFATDIMEIEDGNLELFNHLEVDKLTEDLIQLLKDSIVRFDYYVDLYDGDEDIVSDFVTHAILLLTHVKQEKALPALLDVLRQDGEYIDFWFGDSLSDIVVPVLYFSVQNNIEALISFIKEPNIGAYTKSIVSESLCKILYFKKEVPKAVLVSYCKGILDYFIENKENENIVDTAFLGLFMVDLIQYKCKELLPEIKQLFNLEIVGYWICGDYESLQGAISEEFSEDLLIQENSILETYNAFREQWCNVSDTFFDDEYEDEDFSLEQNPISPSYFVNGVKKIGRNEPCPCGSGKKYKKCCINN